MVTRDPDAGFGTLLSRGVRRRCPRCGGGDIFAGWGRLRDWCQVCGFRFEREPGYFVGAMIVNTAVTIATLLTAMVVTVAAGRPEVAWGVVLPVTVAAAGLTPIVFYPWSKTIWMAIEMSYHRLEDSERQSAARRLTEQTTPPGTLR